MYSHSFVKFQFISLLNYIIRLQYMQEKSRQTLLPGLKLFYEHPPFAGEHFSLSKSIVRGRETLQAYIFSPSVKNQRFLTPPSSEGGMNRLPLRRGVKPPHPPSVRTGHLPLKGEGLRKRSSFRDILNTPWPKGQGGIVILQPECFSIRISQSRWCCPGGNPGARHIHRTGGTWRPLRSAFLPGTPPA